MEMLDTNLANFASSLPSTLLRSCRLLAGLLRTLLADQERQVAACRHWQLSRRCRTLPRRVLEGCMTSRRSSSELAGGSKSGPVVCPISGRVGCWKAFKRSTATPHVQRKRQELVAVVEENWNYRHNARLQFTQPRWLLDAHRNEIKIASL